MKLPREHGAWAMLLLPFVAAIVLARNTTWIILPALLASVAMFVLRDAATEVYRRKYVWKRQSPELTLAVRMTLLCIAVVIATGFALFIVLPRMPLVIMGAGAAMLMIVATYLTAHNRQRSVFLQLASSAGLTASAFIAWMACRRPIESPVVWALWGLLFAHNAASMLTVHARIEARVASRKTDVSRIMHRQAAIAQGVLFIGALVLVFNGIYALAAALLISAAIHTYDVAHLYDPQSLRMRLQTVGVRELILSGLIAALTVAGLW